MKRKSSFGVAYWWVMLCLILGILLLLYGEKETRESITENRMLTGMPELSAETVLDGDFMRDFDAYMADGFFAREKLIDLSNLMLGAFSAKTVEDMMAGGIEQEIAAYNGEEPEDTPRETPSEIAEKNKIPDADAENPKEKPTESDDAPVDPDHPGANFWFRKKDGSLYHVLKVTDYQLETVADALNAYRAALPEDGTVHYMQIPLATLANRWIMGDAFSGWYSNAEDYLQALCDDGVYVHNVPAILEEHIQAGEYVYFRTDHHWAPLGGYYVHAAMMERMGVPATAYDDYSYVVNKNFFGTTYDGSAAMRKMADTIEVMKPLAPVGSYVVRAMQDIRTYGFMVYERNAYSAYLQGTIGPWRRFETGYHTGRVAMVVADSFGNVFVPFLMPYFDTVLMTDFREGYSIEAAGGTVKDYIEAYGITDVIFCCSNVTGFNSQVSLKNLKKYLG